MQRTAEVLLGNRTFRCHTEGIGLEAWWIVDVDGDDVELAPASANESDLANLLEEWFGQVGDRPASR